MWQEDTRVEFVSSIEEAKKFPWWLLIFLVIPLLILMRKKEKK